MRTVKTHAKRLAAGVAAAMLIAAPASAERLDYAFGFQMNSAVGQAAAAYEQEVAERSGGALTIRLFPATLLSLMETGPGLRDGMADVGYVLAPWYPAEYPHYTLLHELTMSMNLRDLTGKETLAYAGAVLEYAMFNCPECLADIQAQNQVYLSGATSSMYALLCTSEVRTIEQLRGKRLRAGSPSFSRFADHFGAVGVQMAANEVFEALNQGVIDCAMLSAPELTTFSLIDVVTDFTIGVPGGLYAGAMVGNMNRDTWLRLTPEQRMYALWGANVLSADISWNFYVQDSENLDMARERGVRVHTADEALTAELRAFVEADMAQIAALFQDDFGVTRADEIVEEFLEMLERWYELVEPVESLEELRELYWDQVYARVDVNTHGH